MKKLSILIVDDEASILMALSRDLKHFSNIARITTASSAREADAYRDVDILITDERMPEKSGMHYIKELHRRGEKTICILMSGHADFDMLMKGINEGQIAGFILKPWTIETLKKVLNNAINQLVKTRISLFFQENDVFEIEDWATVLAETEYLNVNLYKRHLLALTYFIKSKDPELYTHSHRVSILATHFAKHLDYDEDMLYKLALAALVHDIGKLTVKDVIHYKNGKLNTEEYHEMKEHVQAGVSLLTHMGIDKDIIRIVAEHHERVDGKGYPNKLKGESIHILARILAIVDAYDALTTDRVYRMALPQDEALRIIEENVSHIYDEALFKRFRDFIITSHSVINVIDVSLHDIV